MNPINPVFSDRSGHPHPVFCTIFNIYVNQGNRTFVYMFLHNLKSCKSHQTITLYILKTFDSCVSEFYGHPCFTNKTRKHSSRMRAARLLFTVPEVSVRRVFMTETLPGKETPWTGTPPGKNMEPGTKTPQKKHGKKQEVISYRDPPLDQNDRRF